MAEIKNGLGRWAFLERHEIPDLLDPTNIYLSRLRIVETPWFGIFLHQIRRPDNDRQLHNHPWRFYTLILKGGYVESIPMFVNRPAGVRRTKIWKPFSIHGMTRTSYHAITSLLNGPAWTLMFVGPRKHDWGYATVHGYVGHVEYHATRRVGTDGKT